MMVKFTKQALDDVDEIYDYLSKDDENVAKNVLLRIENTIDYIRDFPEMGRKSTVKDIRELNVAKLPFSVIYQIKQEVIYILTIFHNSRNPVKKIK